MDFQNILEKCAVIGIDVFFLGLFYKLYKAESNSLKALKAAQCLELDNELIQKIQDSSGDIPYAVITGKVKALSVPLHSEHFSGIRGVMKEKIIKEYKATWIPFLRMWNTTGCNIKHSTASVPFGIYNKASFFKKPVIVEIIDPSLAQELTLSEVYNDFKTHKGSFGEVIIGFILREHTVGVQEVENILLEDTSLTAVGRLVLDNNTMKLVSPDDGLTYYLTPLSYTALTRKVSNLTMLYKGLTAVMLAISGIILACLLKRGYQEMKHRINYARDLKRRQEARKSERTTHVSEHDPKCVVCLENPVEIVILECGHACLCLNCSDQRLNCCPVCRSEVQRLVPVYMP